MFKYTPLTMDSNDFSITIHDIWDYMGVFRPEDPGTFRPRLHISPKKYQRNTQLVDPSKVFRNRDILKVFFPQKGPFSGVNLLPQNEI